jgi:hypothetical protein
MMKKVLFTLAMTFYLINSFAQVDGTVVVGGVQKGDSKATMEILSQNGTKGFMPPRLTQVQINALQASLVVSNNGLTVFNTDEKCLQSWNGTSWTECNPVLIAKFDVNCASSSIKGTYYKDVPVTNNEYLELEVTVKKAGSYTFVAETQNGVRYFLSSIISTVSAIPQIIRIPAFGTPIATGTFNYNLLDQSGIIICSALPVTVTENNAELNLTCGEAAVTGDFNEKTPVTIKDQMIIKVNVTKTGNYTFKTAVKNGISFFASGSFLYPGEQIVTLRPTGTPTWLAPNGIIPFDILNKDGVSYGCTVNVPVTSGSPTFDVVDCTNGVKVKGDYSIDKGTTSLNYIELTLNVTKPGPYAIETEEKGGISFRASGDFTAAGTQTIQIPASGIPTAVGSLVFNQFKELNSGVALCPTVTVVIQDVIGCFASVGSASGNQIGTWTANVPLTGAQYSVTLAASSVGPYSLQATGSGITLTASGTVPAPGTQNITVTFNASGIPSTAGSIPLLIKGSCGDVATINVNVGVGPGDQTNPGKTCKDILLATSNTAKDGEYWINPLTPGPTGAGGAYKTLCDMTGGGYTLIYSFSEDTNWNKYTWTKYVEYYGDYTNLNVSNYYTDSGSYNKNGYQYLTTGGVIKYDEYRLPTSHMLAINTGAGEYKLRIASNAGKGSMADARGNANYVTFKTVSGADPRVNGTIARGVDGAGKIGGIPFTMTASANGTKGAGTYNGAAGHTFQLVQSSEAMRINWYGNPNVSSSGVWVNLFGYFDGDNDTGRGAQLNDHFQKCVNGANICKSDGNQARTGNNYVMQYFVK